MFRISNSKLKSSIVLLWCKVCKWRKSSNILLTLSMKMAPIFIVQLISRSPATVMWNEAYPSTLLLDMRINCSSSYGVWEFSALLQSCLLLQTKTLGLVLEKKYLIIYFSTVGRRWFPWPNKNYMTYWYVQQGRGKKYPPLINNKREKQPLERSNEKWMNPKQSFMDKWQKFQKSKVSRMVQNNRRQRQALHSIVRQEDERQEV